MNILRVITWLPVGGIEQKLVAILPKIQDAGKGSVRLCCIRERGPLADDLERAGVPVDLIPFKRRWDVPAILKLRNLIRKHKIDVVHSHMYRSNVPAAVAARLAGAKVVVAQVHNVDTWETRRQLWMDRALMGWRDAVVSVSEAVRRDVREKLGVSEQKARLIYNGVDVDRFGSPSPDARDRLREEWGIPQDAVVAMMLSRLHPQKNPLGLLNAFARIEAAVPRLRIVYVGTGPQREEVARMVEERGLASRVHMVGERRDIPDALAAADIAVLPSFKEGFSNTVLESMAAGKPIVCTDVGGNAEVVIPGETGYIEPPGDNEAFGESLKKLAQDSALRQVFGDASRARVQRFSLDRMAQDTIDLYEELLSAKRMRGK